MPERELNAKIQGIVDGLIAGGTALPIVIGTVTAVVEIVKSLRGTAPPLATIIEYIEKQVSLNEIRGQEELARLKYQASVEGT